MTGAARLQGDSRDIEMMPIYPQRGGERDEVVVEEVAEPAIASGGAAAAAAAVDEGEAVATPPAAIFWDQFVYEARDFGRLWFGGGGGEGAAAAAVEGSPAIVARGLTTEEANITAANSASLLEIAFTPDEFRALDVCAGTIALCKEGEALFIRGKGGINSLTTAEVIRSKIESGIAIRRRGKKIVAYGTIEGRVTLHFELSVDVTLGRVIKGLEREGLLLHQTLYVKG